MGHIDIFSLIQRTFSSSFGETELEENHMILISKRPRRPIINNNRLLGWNQDCSSNSHGIELLYKKLFFFLNLSAGFTSYV